MNRMDYLSLCLRLNLVTGIFWIVMILYVALLTYDRSILFRISGGVIGTIFIFIGWLIDMRSIRKMFNLLDRKGD